MTGWTIAVCAALAIIPTTNRDRAVGARVVRGDTPSIQDVTVDPAGVEAARKALAGRERIAVVPFAAQGGGDEFKALARGCTEAVAADLRYAPGLLVLDPSEVAAALKAGDGPVGNGALAEAGRKLGVRYLVTGTVVEMNGGPVYNINLIEIGQPGEDPSGGKSMSTGGGNGRDVVALSATFVNELLPEGHRPGPDAKKEMAKAGTASAKARALCDEAVEILGRSGVAGGDDGRVEKALKLTDEALAADRKYLRAILVQAGCLAKLGNKNKLKQILNRAEQTRGVEDRVDELTRLELKGDYELFVEGSPQKAADAYAQILATDPGHLHALWMLAALHAGEYEPSKWSGFDPKKAGEYAARLVAAHPGTAAAKFFEGPRS